jgi:hypothetical protein
MKVGITKDGKNGYVDYNEVARDVTVHYDGPKAAAERHLTAPQIFRIPESGGIDDFREEKVRPTNSKTHMELALCTLFAETGFWVNWETLRG